MYLLFIHFLVNFTILYFYIGFKQEIYIKIYKEILLTIFFGWIIILYTIFTED